MNVSDLLKDYQPLHSTYQLVYAIVGKNGETPYGWYCQALREIAGRAKTLRAIYSAMMKLKREWEAAQKEEDEIRREREIELTAAYMEAELSMKELARELSVLIPLAEHLKEQIGELTPEKREQLERIEWTEKIKARAALDLMSFGRLSRDFFDLYRNAPDDVRRELYPILELQEVRARLVKNLKNERKPIPAVTPLPLCDVRKKLGLPKELPMLKGTSDVAGSIVGA